MFFNSFTNDLLSKKELRNVVAFNRKLLSRFLKTRNIVKAQLFENTMIPRLFQKTTFSFLQVDTNQN